MIDKPLVRLIKNKREKAKINKFRYQKVIKQVKWRF